MSSVQTTWKRWSTRRNSVTSRGNGSKSPGNDGLHEEIPLPRGVTTQCVRPSVFRPTSNLNQHMLAFPRLLWPCFASIPVDVIDVKRVAIRLCLAAILVNVVGVSGCRTTISGDSRQHSWLNILLNSNLVVQILVWKLYLYYQLFFRGTNFLLNSNLVVQILVWKRFLGFNNTNWNAGT